MYHTNAETEQQLLGGLIFKNNLLFELDVSSDDFAFPHHQKIYGEMKKIYADKQSFGLADFLNVKEREYLSSVVDAVILPTNDNINSYAQSLKEMARKRRILEALDTAKFMLEESTSSEVMAYLQAALTETFDTTSLKTAEQVFEEIINDLELPPVRYTTGLRYLDTALGGGFYEGFTYGLAGAEKSGKTTFAHTISSNLSEQGTKHLYVALEMGSKQIEQRNLARKMKVNSLQFLNQADQVKDKIHGLAPNRHTIYLDAPGADLQTILNQVGVAKMKFGITGFIVDYWQLVEGKDNTEEKHLRTVAQGIANYARRQKLWCLLLAQRNAEGKLFGGGGLKKACDQLYFIETIEGLDDVRWLSMDASRYTPKADIGGPANPMFVLNKKHGPYVHDK